MIDLSTKYMGLHLRNPVIVASCGLTKTLDGVRRCADAGAGAIVLKSLFEEQIDIETKDLEKDLWPAWHPETFRYVREMRMGIGSKEYLELIKGAKSAVSIPIIASLNCITPKWWSDYAKQIELAGADALELNISFMPSDPNRSSQEIEHLYFKILESVKSRIDIPIAVKIGPCFTSIAQMANELSRYGASALVLFNRFYRFDIDIEKMEIIPCSPFSSPDEIGTPMRWIALLAGRIDCELVGSTGIHNGAGVIKLLLAGATAVQVCSTLYNNKVEYISSILSDIKAWMKKHAFNSIDQIRGLLSQMRSSRPELYERLQYIKSLTGIE